MAGKGLGIQYLGDLTWLLFHECITQTANDSTELKSVRPWQFQEKKKLHYGTKYFAFEKLSRLKIIKTLAVVQGTE